MPGGGQRQEPREAVRLQRQPQGLEPLLLWFPNIVRCFFCSKNVLVW